MLSTFKDFFIPKHILGLEITDTFIGAVRIFNSMKGLEIDRIAFREVENPENISLEVGDFIREENLKHEMLITCLPAASAIIRKIPLSFSKTKKISKIIKYQMEPGYGNRRPKGIHGPAFGESISDRSGAPCCES
jgi:hypothetical protein